MMKKRIALLILIASFILTMALVSCTTSQAEEVSDIELDSSSESGSVIYVDTDATGNNDGTSWANAYNNLQDALSAAETNTAIWVAEGTYYPTTDDDRTISFSMVDEVAVYGGFDGTETTLDERDWENNVTILSGNIGDKDDSSDNSNNVVVAANNLLDGFTVTAGNGGGAMMGPPSGGEGKMGVPPEGEGEIGAPPKGENPEGDPSGESADAGADGEDGDQGVGHLTMDTLFMGDPEESMSGNGIVVMNVAPTIKNTIITENAGGKGAGVYIAGLPESGEYPTFINVIISNNEGFGRGGGVAMDLTYAFFIDVIFDTNESTSGKGGAIYNDIMAIPLIENGLFINNSTDSGAALANDGNSNAIISNSTIYGNIASEEGGALYQGTGAYNDPVVIDSIIWDNYSVQGENSVFNWSECNPDISYSIVQGGYDGVSVLDVDPQFADADNMNFEIVADSAAATAGSDGGEIGFDASLMGQRTDEEIEEIKEYLLSLEADSNVTSIDLSNPVDQTDAENIGDIVYVDVDAAGNDDGSSWTDAFTSFQTAIDYANAAYELNGTDVDMWVAEGTYYTGEERSDSFILRSGVNVYGGFTGTEISIDERDYSVNETILSGEIGDPSVATDNSYHVVVGADEAIIDGFTITGGYADGVDGATYDNKGGGLLNYLGGNRDIPILDFTLGFDTVITNVTFEDNYAVSGGAAYTFHGGNPVYTNVTFSNNTAKYGGAVADVAGTNAIYTDCVFENNSAIYKGGATFTDYGSMAQFYDCTFDKNESGTAGGAIYVLDRASQQIDNETDFYLIDDSWSLLTDIFSSVYVEDCSFTGNVAGTNGGAMYVYESSYGKILNSTFEENAAVDAAVVANNDGHLILDSATTFWNNSSEDIYVADDSSITYE